MYCEEKTAERTAYQLPDETKDERAIRLRTEGKTFREIGAAMGVDAAMAHRRVKRAVMGRQCEMEDRMEDTWYAVVMGQSGMTLGVAMYEDLATFESLLTGQLSDRESARQTSAVSITFGEAFEIAPRDLEAAEKHGWHVAGPEAFPHALRIDPGGNLRPPLSWELELLDACLRALPKFLHDAQAAQPFAVDTHVGRVSLAWIE